MDPITMIVAALAAGASAGLGDTAAQTVRDAYASLKAAVARRFGHNSKAGEVLADHEKDPVTYERPLAKELRAVGAENDPQILRSAEALLRLAEQAGQPATYQVTVTGGQVGPIGAGARVGSMTQSVKVRKKRKGDSKS